MFKALVLINESGRGTREASSTAIKVELTDDNLHRLVGRVQKHLEIISAESQPAVGAISPRPVRDNPQA